MDFQRKKKNKQSLSEEWIFKFIVLSRRFRLPFLSDTFTPQSIGFSIKKKHCSFILQLIPFCTSKCVKVHFVQEKHYGINTRYRKNLQQIITLEY